MHKIGIQNVYILAKHITRNTKNAYVPKLTGEKQNTTHQNKQGKTGKNSSGKMT